MSGEYWLCRNLKDVECFIDYIRKEWDFEKHILKIDWKKYSGKMSINQRGLLHVWIREMTKFLNDHKPDGFSEKYTEAWTKTHLKRRFGIVDKFPDPVSGEPVASLRSTEDYDLGEMFHLLTNIRQYALDHFDLHLVVMGEYEQLLKEHDASR